jgi:hypothetical protein
MGGPLVESHHPSHPAVILSPETDVAGRVRVRVDDEAAMRSSSDDRDIAAAPPAALPP